MVAVIAGVSAGLVTFFLSVILPGYDFIWGMIAMFFIEEAVDAVNRYQGEE